ncbi:rab11 family-interacting protein 1-like [Acipenser ruthenus]|uniref:rab11 family-interacting protein 1-like n=1 Tax=Acipenser ruthenus TaxID=7906 RepID=UPI0027406F24|nr:rab11 family-interacting protein 1-like [Acipenser ruthenus]XP_058869776.1 rab11 family-interacting protein 1-like [Acipenser ruthenus]XP_058869777.1 rab11 family-interacting protein 1-like [Acipenser ruthenus]
MSLAEQSQQWYPTNVNVTVLQAHSLKAKGKNGTNDAYAIIQLGKEKFSTSVSEKSLAPVWREEASFELPVFHQGNQERCMLRIVVMHRALVGLDQFLGEAVINLLELHENKERNKTEWFKLQSKAGKKEKERGEVHVNIQFMRNNMTASMFDLSMKDKSRSPFGKLKDKIRGKKDRGGFSDSASAIVPRVSQVLTDSEGEEEGGGGVEKPKKSAKSKIKSIFGKSSNLQRSSLSQSMSVLPSLQPLPERNAWLSGSRSSGLDVEPSLSAVPETKVEGKPPLPKPPTHKHTLSADTKQLFSGKKDPFSLLGGLRSKNDPVSHSSVCINGSHVYAEEPDPEAGLSGSLQNLSGATNIGSTEDFTILKSSDQASTESLKSRTLPSYRVQSTSATQKNREELQEENAAKKAEEKKRLDEERKRSQQQEEEQRRREDERKRVEERKRQEEENRQRVAAAEEEKKRQEEIRKKEERKTAEKSESSKASTLLSLVRGRKDSLKNSDSVSPPETPADRKTEPVPKRQGSQEFEEVPLRRKPLVPSKEEQDPDPHLQEKERGAKNPSTPTTGFPSWATSKVTAVKPRLDVSLKDETKDRLPSLSTSPLPPVSALSNPFTSTPCSSSSSPPSPTPFQDSSVPLCREVSSGSTPAGSLLKENRKSVLKTDPSKGGEEPQLSPGTPKFEPTASLVYPNIPGPASGQKSSAGSTGKDGESDFVAKAKGEDGSVLYSPSSRPASALDLLSKASSSSISRSPAAASLFEKGRQSGASSSASVPEGSGPPATPASVFDLLSKAASRTSRASSSGSNSPIVSVSESPIENINKPASDSDPLLKENLRPPSLFDSSIVLASISDSDFERVNKSASVSDSLLKNTSRPPSVSDTPYETIKISDSLPEANSRQSSLSDSSTVLASVCNPPIENVTTSVSLSKETLSDSPFKNATRPAFVSEATSRSRKPSTSETASEKQLKADPLASSFSFKSVIQKRSGSGDPKSPPPELKSDEKPAKLDVKPDSSTSEREKSETTGVPEPSEPASKHFRTEREVPKPAPRAPKSSRTEPWGPTEPAASTPKPAPRTITAQQAGKEESAAPILTHSPPSNKPGTNSSPVEAEERSSPSARSPTAVNKPPPSLGAKGSSQGVGVTGLFDGRLGGRVPSASPGPDKSVDKGKQACSDQTARDRDAQKDKQAGGVSMEKSKLPDKSSGEVFKTKDKLAASDKKDQSRSGGTVAAKDRDTLLHQSTRMNQKDEQTLQDKNAGEMLSQKDKQTEKNADDRLTALSNKSTGDSLKPKDKQTLSDASDIEAQKLSVLSTKPTPSPPDKNVSGISSQEVKLAKPDQGTEETITANTKKPLENKNAGLEKDKRTLSEQTSEKDRRTPPASVEDAEGDTSPLPAVQNKPAVISARKRAERTEPSSTPRSNLEKQTGEEVAESQRKSKTESLSPPPSSSFSPLPPSPSSKTVVNSPAQPISSGGKRLLRAWVSPSETQPITVQQSPGSVQCRPHPVKPMSSQDSQTSRMEKDPKSSGVKDTPSGRSGLVISKFTDPSDAAPYSQLTHDELVALLVKQKEALSKKDCQIRDLEDYIDNLLVRVMEETPNILRNLPSKQAGRV